MYLLVYIDKFVDQNLCKVSIDSNVYKSIGGKLFIEKHVKTSLYINVELSIEQK